jgi:hypothetical protein
MNTDSLLTLGALAALPVAILFVVFLAYLLGRIRAARRAHAIIGRHPGAERKSVYFAFRSTFAWDIEREMDAKIAEMTRSGWAFLRATEANPFLTLRSWGGGLNLHFIRAHVAGSSGASCLTEYINRPTNTTNTKADL